MSMVGSKCGFITRYTTDDEIETCRHITISNEHDWDPSKDIFKILSTEEEKRSNIFNLSSTNQVRSKTPYAPPVTYIQDKMAIHDFDRAMLYVSIGLAHYLMVGRLIWIIRVFMTKNGYATVTNERHHSVPPELLARKWGMVLVKAKETMRTTNQVCISSS